MSREMNAATQAEFAKRRFWPILLCELKFDSGCFRMWTGLGTINWRGETWHGCGNLAKVGTVTETLEPRVAPLVIELGKIGPEVLKIAVKEDWQGRPGVAYQGVLSEARQLIGEPFQLRRGMMDMMSLGHGAEHFIRLTISGRDIDLRRNVVRRYTPGDQRGEFPDDAVFDFIPALQDKVIRLPSS